MDRLDRERRYRAAAREWQHYEEWKRDRNPARAELEVRFGYDTKHAMHLMRLMRMGVEILETSEVRVRRPDAEELLAVRQGALTFDALMEETARLEAALLAAEGATSLPERPDEDVLDAACAQIVESALGYAP